MNKVSLTYRIIICQHGRRTVYGHGNDALRFRVEGNFSATEWPKRVPAAGEDAKERLWKFFAPE